MGILNSASSNSVYRGYEYYKNNKVITYTQISEYEYEGYVKGTKKEAYHVIINTKHPRKSSCDCPFANGHTTCKHMVSLFFQVSPDDLRDYENWYENDYYDDEEDHYDEWENDYYDDYNYNYSDRYYREKTKFVKPIFFDATLNSFIDKLSEKEAKDILLGALMKDEEETFNTYLKEEYKKMINTNNIYSILENLNKKTYNLTNDCDYNYTNYKVDILTKKEKQIIAKEYINNDNIRKKVNSIFLNPDLATYDDYKWFATLFKNENNKNEIDEYIKKLESFLNTLKHYSIKNTIPKSNILITIEMLKNNSIEEKGISLFENCRYPEYIEYTINNEKNIDELYICFKNCLQGKIFLNYENIANVFYNFYLKEENDEMYNESLYYRFLCSKDITFLRCLQFSPKFDYYIQKLLNMNDLFISEKVYIVLDKKEELFKLLYKKENERRLISNIEFLKDEYNEEIYNYLRNRFYEIVDKEKNRQAYNRACEYIKAIYKLNNGKEKVVNLINELKSSEYYKRTALFDEINKI